MHRRPDSDPGSTRVLEFAVRQIAPDAGQPEIGVGFMELLPGFSLLLAGKGLVRVSTAGPAEPDVVFCPAVI